MSYLDSLTPPPKIDTMTVPKHLASLTFQYSVIMLSLKILFTKVFPVLPSWLATVLTWFTYAGLSLKSRTFILMDNRRPGKRERGTLGWYDREMPKWTVSGRAGLGWSEAGGAQRR